MTNRPGITVLEVLVALVLCICVVGLGMMLLARHRENSLREQCKLNLMRMGEAFQSYHDLSAVDKKLQRLPPARVAEGYATWAVLLAPYTAKDHALQGWDQEQSYFNQKDEIREARSYLFFCPSRRRSETLSLAGDVDAANKHFPGGLGDYAAVAGDGSKDHDWTGPKANGPLVIADVSERKGDRVIKWQSRTNLDTLTRGESNTLLVGEKHVVTDHFGDAAFGDGSLYNGQQPANFARVVGPGYPLANAIDAPFNNNFGSYHKNATFFLFADKSVRVFTTDASEVVLGKLARRGD